MLRNVWLKAVRDQRRALLGWGLGLIALVAMYASVFPSVRENAANLRGYVESLPEAFREIVGGDFTSPAGYLRSELFATMAPLLLLVYAIGAGGRAIAGEEERHTLDLLLSTPVRRSSVVVQKFVAITVGVAILSALVFGAIALLGPPFELEVGLEVLAAACLQTGLLALAFGGVGLFFGAALGRRGVAVGATSGLAVAAYLLHLFAPSVETLQPVHAISPFYWALENDPIANGLDPAGAGVLVAIAVVSVALAAVAFGRRDLAV